MGKYKFSRDELTIPLEEIKRTIKAQSRPWMRSLIGFLYIYGARISEALKVRVKDVEFDREKKLVGVYIQVALKGEKKTVGPFTSDPHVVWAPLDTTFMPLFLDRVKVKSKGGMPKTRLWPYTRQAAWYHINKVNPRLSPHTFRHSRLQHLADQGLSIYDLRDFAGWTDTRQAETYVKRSKERLKSIAPKIK